MMAEIEKIQLIAGQFIEQHLAAATSSVAMPGLRINVRLTTSSLADYPTFDLGAIQSPELVNIITDGASS